MVKKEFLESKEPAAEIVDRHRVDAAILRAEALLNGIGEISTDPIYAKDVDGRFIYANPAHNARFELSNRVGVGFTGSDPNGLVDARHEYLSIADASGLRACHDRLDCRFDLVVMEDNFNSHLGHKRCGIGRPAVKLGMTHLAADPLHFGHGGSLYANLMQRYADLFKLEGFDDCDDFLHCRPVLSGFKLRRL